MSSSVVVSSPRDKQNTVLEKVDKNFNSTVGFEKSSYQKRRFSQRPDYDIVSHKNLDPKMSVDKHVLY